MVSAGGGQGTIGDGDGYAHASRQTVMDVARRQAFGVAGQGADQNA